MAMPLDTESMVRSVISVLYSKMILFTRLQNCPYVSLFIFFSMAFFDIFVLMLLRTFPTGFKSVDLGDILSNWHPTVSIASFVKALFCDGPPF